MSDSNAKFASAIEAATSDWIEARRAEEVNENAGAFRSGEPAGDGDSLMISSPKTPSPALANLVTEYIEAKHAEAAAEKRRVAIGEHLATLLGRPDEGSKTHEVGAFKVTVKQPVNRKVDWAAFDAACAANKDQHAPVVTKRELDTKGLRWIQENAPEFYKALARAITATPGRVALEIKET